MVYFFVALGSFGGATLRFLIKDCKFFANYGIMPFDTFLINVAGAFLIAFLSTLAWEKLHFNTDIRTGLTTGLLGAFTTFSTLCKESASLLRSGAYGSAVVYMTGSLLLGLLAAWAGYALAMKVGSIPAEKEQQ
ncbi:MAG: CrcB family protein [Acidaminococcaceae bacterium]|jgi:CrcB protein|nr:CrcB family protein [Acidaminococcaceae bacterium]